MDTCQVAVHVVLKSDIMKVAIYSARNYELSFLETANSGKHEFVFTEKPLNTETTDLAEGCKAVSVFVNDEGSAEVLVKLAAAGVKNIAVRAAGYDNINLAKARELNINVANVPEYSPYSIAEHSIAMMLTLNRRIIQADRNVKNYNFLLGSLVGFDLNGKTVGIIGLGKIGGIVAKILHGFGCSILGYDINTDNALTQKYGVEYVSLQDLCRRSDIITLHAPLNEHTRYIINKDSLSLMKKGVMIINTGRGGLLNTADAIDALKTGQIGYLGLDVYEKEKGMFFFDHSDHIMKDDMFARLLSFKNVLVTGHQAFLTENALKNIADTTVATLDSWGQNKPSAHELIK